MVRSKGIFREKFGASVMVSTSRPYEAIPNGARNTAYEYCVNGPGDGFGYHSHCGWPRRQFETKELAKIVANMCNDAYEAGMRAKEQHVKEVLGIL